MPARGTERAASSALRQQVVRQCACTPPPTSTATGHAHPRASHLLVSHKLGRHLGPVARGRDPIASSAVEPPGAPARSPLERSPRFDGLCCVLELSRHGCASCAPSRRVTFLRRRGEAHPSTSSSSARAAAPPSMAAAAEAAAAATVRCPFLFEYTPNAPLSATHPPSAGAGRCSRRRADVARAAVS